MSLSDTLMNYLNETRSKAASEHYAPHPIIKALMLALEAAQKGAVDGNYMGLSGDADLTPDKQPQLMFSLAMEKKGKKFKVLEVREAHKVVSAEMAEKIVHSETLIEKFETPDIPNKNAESIMTDALGFPVHILDDNAEIEEALMNAQNELKNGGVPNISWQVRDEILSQKDASNWSQFFKETRALIGSLWAPKSGKRIVITSLAHSVPKWQLRAWIFHFLDFDSGDLHSISNLLRKDP